MKQKTILKLPKLIGHRGVKNLCPENTIESINKAFDLGLKFVEIDVKISQDGIPILLHDDTIDRTTGGEGLVSKLNYKYLQTLDAGKHFYGRKTNNLIPKLSDVLKLCKKRNGNLNIELKPNKGLEKRNILKILELTKDNNDIDIFYSSFDLTSFKEISRVAPNTHRSFLLDTFINYSVEDLISILKQNNANICGLNINIISNDLIKKIKNNNILITVYSDKNIKVEEAKGCYEIGIDSIFVDDPTKMLKQI